MDYDPNWRCILKILHLTYKDANGNIIWEKRNLKNTLHKEGEQFILNAVFAGGKTNNVYIPTSYYFGLDNRTAIDVDDVMSTISNGSYEPITGSYSRQTVSSLSAFTTTLSNLGPGTYYQATGPIITFSASGGSWGPVANLFLTTALTNSGALICSVPLADSLSLSSGESLSVRLGVSLRDDRF